MVIRGARPAESGLVRSVGRAVWRLCGNQWNRRTAMKRGEPTATGSGGTVSAQHGVPLADAWLPVLGDGRDPAARKSWRELKLPERRKWIVRTGLFAALALTLVLHPSSAVRDVVVWLSFFIILFLRRKTLFKQKPDLLSLAVLAYGVLVAVSVVYSAHRNWSARDAWRFSVVLAMVFVAWHLFKNRAFFFGSMQLLVGALLVVCVYDVVTYLSGLGRLWEWGERWVHGPYHGHPNPASAVILVMFPMSVFLLVASRSIWLRVMHGLFLVLGLFLVYVMASRTAQLGLAGMIVCAAFLVRPGKRRIIAVAAVVAFFAAAYLNLRALNPRFVDETMKTLTFRDENWRNLGKLIAKRPVFGYGYGKRNYQTVYHRSFPGSPIGYQHAHSLVLQTAFETGAVGLAVVLWLFVVIVFRLLKAYAANMNRYGRLMAVLFVSVVGTSIYCLAEVPDGLLRSLFWLLVAMVGALTGGDREGKSLIPAGVANDSAEGTSV